MRLHRVGAASGAALLTALATSVAAEEAPGPDPYFPELKLGFLLHDVARDNEDSNTLSLNLELIWSDLEYWDFESQFLEVLLNPVPMIGWALTIMILLMISIGPLFIGLFVALPILGHTTWHLYRKLVAPEGEQLPEGEQPPDEKPVTGASKRPASHDSFP